MVHDEYYATSLQLTSISRPFARTERRRGSPERGLRISVAHVSCVGTDKPGGKTYQTHLPRLVRLSQDPGSRSIP